MTTAERLQKLVPQVSFSNMKEVSTYWATVPHVYGVSDSKAIDFSVVADRTLFCEIISDTADLIDWTFVVKPKLSPESQSKFKTITRWINRTQTPGPNATNLQILVDIIKLLRNAIEPELLRDAELGFEINIVFDENKAANKILRRKSSNEAERTSTQVELLPPPSALETLRRRLSKALHFEVTGAQAIDYALGVALKLSESQILGV